MWQPIEAVRQVRPDHAVEVKVGGVWHVGYTLDWKRTSTTSGPARVGELVKVRE